MGVPLSCFKAYDIRGQIPNELDDALAHAIGRAYASFLSPRRVIVGRDVRTSSSDLCQALTRGLLQGGADVYDIGLCGTEEVYFATFDGQFDGGIMVTASHNPMDYNGMKLVRELSKPISADTGLTEIHDIVVSQSYGSTGKPGCLQAVDDSRNRYVAHLLSYIDLESLTPLKIVVNAGNGGAGLVVDCLERHLPFEIIKIQHEPDGTFPNGIPNPLLPERRQATVDAIARHGADLGIAWDGDFDRCFFFDETGAFIEGYYIVGLLAEALLRDQPGGRIIFDPRLTWNTIDTVRQAGGDAIQCRSGHAFIKQSMREHDALYGGEMSAHHYFRDFSFCDSGMIPWLLVTEQLCRLGKPLSELVCERMAAFPCSGEINFQVEDPAAIIEKIRADYAPGASRIDTMDGIGLEFETWRFNLRASNTEPLLRLNVETRGDRGELGYRTSELSKLISGH